MPLSFNFMNLPASQEMYCSLFTRSSTNFSKWVANIIFLESPAGVGFSYAENKNYSTDDDTVAHDNYLALLHFFKKFPDFKKNEFFIMGESYAGIYIPTLSLKVLKGEEINFKGFAIGNGQMDAVNSMNAIVFFSYYHGLLGQKLWKRLALHCCGGVAAQETCNFCNSDSHHCQDAVQEVADNIVGSGINIYNIYSDCKMPVNKKSQDSSIARDTHYKSIQQGCHKLNGLPVVPPCLNSSAEKTYLNQQNVRQSLHIPSFVQDWESCSYEVAIGYIRKYITMKKIVLELIQSNKLRGLIYNGDTDLLCNFLSGEWFTAELGLKVIGEYKSGNIKSKLLDL